MSDSPSFSLQIYKVARPFAARVFAVPVLGYASRILVGIAKLPRMNMHLRRIAEENAPLSARLTAIEGLTARVTGLETAWRQHVPAFLNAVGTVPALARELSQFRERMDQAAIRLDNADAVNDAVREQLGSAQKRMDQATIRLDNADASNRAIWEQMNAIRQLISAIREQMKSTQERLDQALIRLDNADAGNRAIWERIEFVRREVLFELAYSKDAPENPVAAAKGTVRIAAPEKLATAQTDGTLRLNLGCGHVALPDYVNVDLRDLPGVDVVAGVDNLPFEPGSVDEIFSSHLMEHFPQEEIRRQLLPYWYSLLRPGGTFRAITPDAEAMLAEAGAGSYSFEDFREVVFGAQDYAGDYHYNLFTPASLSHLMEEAGFCDIEVPITARRNGKCFEFEICARRS